MNDVWAVFVYFASFARAWLRCCSFSLLLMAACDSNICKNCGQALSRPAKQQGLPALPHANPSVHSPQSTADSGDNDIGEPR